MPTIITDPRINEGDTIKSFLSTTMVCEAWSAEGLDKLTPIIIATMMRKVMDMRSRNGKSGNAPLVQTGRNFNTVDTGMVIRLPVSAAAAVVRFQKKPSRNIASTPGEINPTYSWMN